MRLSPLVLFLALTPDIAAQSFESRNPRSQLRYQQRFGPGGIDGGPVFSTDGRVYDFDGGAYEAGPLLPGSPSDVQFCFYPPRRERVVVQRAQVASMSETWVRMADGFEFRGLGPLQLVQSPIGYDPTRQVLVAVLNSSLVGRTTEYSWTGGSWVQLPAPPAARGQVRALAPDFARRRLVALCESATSALEVWEHDGTAWTQIPFTASLPQFATARSLAWDPRTQRVMLFGQDLSPAGQTWLWDGVNWTHVVTATTPVQELQNRLLLAYDPVHDTLRIAHAGGREWLWTGSDWQVTAAIGPLQSYGQAFDPIRHRFIRFDDAGTYLGIDSNWQYLPPGPVPMRDEQLAYHLGADIALLFHLPQGVQQPAQTWSISSTGAWTQLTSAVQPPARELHALLASPLTNEVVLFGGDDANGTHGDTWVWNGQWADRTATLALAPNPGRAVSGNGDLLVPPITVASGQVWEWVGSWQLVSAFVPIPGPLTATVRADGTKVVSGLDLAGNYVASQFRNGAWSQLAPPPMHTDALAEDPLRGSLIALAQGNESVLTSASAHDVALGTGCGAPAPRLDGVGRASIANPDYLLQVRADAAAPVLLAIGGPQVSLPLGGGCTQYLGGVSLALFAIADASGRAGFGLPIPNAPALRGQQVIAQAVVLQAGGPLGGIALTPGLAITVGD